MSKTRGVFFGVFLFTEEEVTLVPSFSKTEAERQRAFRDFEMSAIRDLDPVPPIISDDATTTLLLDVCRIATKLHTGLDFRRGSGDIVDAPAVQRPLGALPIQYESFLYHTVDNARVEVARMCLFAYENYSRGRPDHGLSVIVRTNVNASVLAGALVSAAYNAGLVKSSAAVVDAKIEEILTAQSVVLEPLVHAALVGTRTALNNFTQTLAGADLAMAKLQSMPGTPATDKARKLVNRLCRIVDALELAHNKLEGDKP
jgi:hypothetical protein